MADAEIISLDEATEEVTVHEMAKVCVNRGWYHVITIDGTSDTDYMVAFVSPKDPAVKDEEQGVEAVEDLLRGEFEDRILGGGLSLDEALDLIADDIREKGVGEPS
jgi:hypothetical protein